jgi:hypothetical protein
MSVKEAITRGYNFFVIAVLGILGGTLVTELAGEDEWLHRLDEILVIAMAVVALVWYLVGRHRVSRSLVPLTLAFAAFGAKILGLVLEIRDPADAGDDIGVVQFLLLFVIVATVAYVRTRPTAGSIKG